MAAIKTAKTYVQIGLGLEAFKEEFPRDEIPFMLMEAIGASPTIIQRYREGKGTVASFNGLLIKNILAYRLVRTQDINAQLEEMKFDKWVVKNKPAIIAVSDGDIIKAFDPSVEETYENHLNNIYTDYEFFSPMWGVRKIRNIEENEADVKAAYKMAQIHDEIRRYNQIGITDDVHDLNLFMSRLLFCFFAEDTGIFEKDVLTKTINETTRPDGTDLQEFFIGAFQTMDKSIRIGINSRFAQFPYVNGGLFSKQIQVPKMNARIRKLILECGNLNWAKINPDIFGSMIQAVVSPELRSGMGIHYTSVTNIKKVINPLFLDELYEIYRDLERKQKEQDGIFDQSVDGRNHYFHNCKTIIRNCNNLLARMKKMKFFDPACGSGNFLIISYKELRMLEMKILKLMKRMTPEYQLEFADCSIIDINHFYGLEINDFACETAVLSLWLAEHQMDNLFMKDFGVNIKALPLKSNSNFHCGNACRLDWNTICPHKREEEVFVMGNPPYIGSSMQDDKQKDDLANVCGKFENYKNLDYIACWFYLAAQYIKDSSAKSAFVTTNSICQGDSVALLWPNIFNMNIEISFAYQSFKWTNNAKYNAGVTVAVIGLSVVRKNDKRLYDSQNHVKVCSNINAYLLDAPNVIVGRHSKSISGFQEMVFGNKPTDGGFLILDKFERDQLLSDYPEAKPLVRRYEGADSYINGEERFCLWINDNQLSLAKSIPPIQARLNKVSEFRLKSKAESTVLYADRPYMFKQRAHQETDSLIVPRVSSETREYIPIGFLSKDTIINDAAQVVYNADKLVFGILNSSMHMSWVRAIGGRLETRYRYSSLVYNSFPFPKITKAKKDEIEDAAWDVLAARENHYGKTLAELYDPETMPPDLREAHHKLDLIVDSCYRDRPFNDENERLELLLKLYDKMKNNK